MDSATLQRAWCYRPRIETSFKLMGDISNNYAVQGSPKCHIKGFFIIFNFSLKTFFCLNFSICGFWWCTLYNVFCNLITFRACIKAVISSGLIGIYEFSRSLFGLFPLFNSVRPFSALWYYVSYIFALSPTNSVIIILLFSSFIRPSTFLFTRGIHVVRIIARVESSDIAFHRLLLLDSIYCKTVFVGVHDLAFVAVCRIRRHSWWNSFKQTFEYVHTHVNRFVNLNLKFAQFNSDQIFCQDAITVKIRLRDHCLRAVPFYY